MKRKNCTFCGIPKKLSEFHKRAASQDGHSHHCKECVKGKNRDYSELREARTRVIDPEGPTTPEDMGELLKLARLRKGLSIQNAARRAKLTPKHLELIELGRRWGAVASWINLFELMGGKVVVKGNPPTLMLTPGGKAGDKG